MNGMQSEGSKLLKWMGDKGRRQVCLTVILLVFFTDVLFLVRSLTSGRGVSGQVLFCLIPILVGLEMALILVLVAVLDAKRKGQSLREVLAPYLLLGLSAMMGAMFLLLLIMSEDRMLFGSFLLVMMVYSIYYDIRSIAAYVKQRAAYVGGRNLFFLLLGVSILVNGFFAFHVFDTEIYTQVGVERTPVEVHTVYNEDGTVKHREDGSVVEEIEYEEEGVFGLKLNYPLLLCPAVSIGSLYLFQKKYQTGRR